MLFGGQEVTRVYMRIAYEFKLLNEVLGLQCKRTRSIADFIRGLARLGSFLNKCIIPHKKERDLSVTLD